MKKIYKVAKTFQQKLALASNKNLENLKLIYRLSTKVGKLLKDLWMTANKDPYSDFNSEIGNAADKISRIGQNAYYQATTKGMPIAGQFGYAAFLNKMNEAIQELESLGPFTNLDPSTSNTLGELKQTLYKAQSEFIPIDISAPTKTIVMPEDKITSYFPEGEEDYMNQISRPGKPWSGEFPT